MYEFHTFFTDTDTRGVISRYRHEIATDGESIYVFGGGTAIEVFALDTVSHQHTTTSPQSHTVESIVPNRSM